MLVPVLVLCSAVAGGFLAGVVCFLVGGMGGIWSLNRRLASVEDAAEKIDDRITREVKSRAAVTSVSRRSERENLAEAAALLAARPPVNEATSTAPPGRY